MNETVIKADINTVNCGFKCGKMPECAPLASTYVPAQQKGSPKYAAAEALKRGTLFPGLDLPFKNIPNESVPYSGTPLGELMSLWFVIKELNLYLDTHKQDAEAFEALREAVALYETGYAKYTEKYGPIKLTDLGEAESYNWLNGPWPWEYAERTEDK